MESHVREFLAGLLDSGPVTLTLLVLLNLFLPDYGWFLDDIIFIESALLIHGWFMRDDDSEEFKDWFPNALMGRLMSLPAQIELETVYTNPVVLITPIMSSWHNLDSSGGSESLSQRIEYFWRRPTYFTGYGLLSGLARTTAVYHLPYLRLATTIGSIYFTKIGSNLLLEESVILVQSKTRSGESFSHNRWP